MARRFVIVMMVLGLAGTGCASRGPSASAPAPTAAGDARRVIVAWLECEECGDGELTAVVKLGEAAVPSLVATLRDGPSPASREQHRRHLVATYADLKRFAAGRPDRKLIASEDEYVRMFADNYVALYRVRSAVALGAMHGYAISQRLQQMSRDVLQVQQRAHAASSPPR